MKPDPKPTLGYEGILANVDHLENLVTQSYHLWQQYLAELEYWSDELSKVSEH